MHAGQPWVLSGMYTHSGTICSSFYGSLVRHQVRHDVTQHFLLGTFQASIIDEGCTKNSLRSSSTILAHLFFGASSPLSVRAGWFGYWNCCKMNRILMSTTLPSSILLPPPPHTRVHGKHGIRHSVFEEPPRCCVLFTLPHNIWGLWLHAHVRTSTAHDCTQMVLLGSHTVQICAFACAWACARCISWPRTC